MDNSVALCQCLTNDTTLFDVVYLDIVHGFDVPNDVLLRYVDKGWTAGFVCRLASCYYIEFDRGVFRDRVKHSILLKSLLMMQHTLDRDNLNLETISVCIYTLIKLEEFEIAIRVLESGADQMLESDDGICIDDLESVIGDKTKNEFHKMTDITEGGFNIKGLRMSFRVFCLYFSYVCYKNLGQEEKLCSVIGLFSAIHIIHLSNFHWEKENLTLLLNLYLNILNI